MKKLVVIPAYNEAENIKKVIHDLETNAREFDYIIINDCSTDDTYHVCIENDYNIVNLPINLGIGGAMQTGYKYAKEFGYDIVVQFDGDGQHNAKYLNKMLQKMISEDVDMVIGSRFIENKGFQSSVARRIGINFFRYLLKLLFRKDITDATSGLRMINKKIINEFCGNYPNDYPEPETTAIMLRKGYTVEEIAVVMNSREHGVSSINLTKSIYYMIKVSMAIVIDYIRKWI